MKFVLFVLAACVCLIGCNPAQKAPTQVAPVEKPQTVFYVQVDSELLPKIPFEAADQMKPLQGQQPLVNWIKKCLTEAAEKQGIPLTVWKVTNACKGGPGETSNIWNAACSVEGVDDIDTLKCIGNTLIQIPFVHMVGTRDFQVFKPRRCGNAGVDPADVKRMEELKRLGEQLQDTTPNTTK